VLGDLPGDVDAVAAKPLDHVEAVGVELGPLRLGLDLSPTTSR